MRYTKDARAALSVALVAAIALAAISPTNAEQGEIMIKQLKCEYLTNPAGIDTAKPQLSWVIEDSRRGARQTAYQVRAATNAASLAAGDADLWDSGRVESDATLGLLYDGKPLGSGQQVVWQVKVWMTALDGVESESAWSEPARFSVGLLSPEDWRAKWITASEFLPDSPKHVGYLSEMTLDQTDAKWVRVDLGRSAQIDGIRLHPACGRRGALPPGGEYPPGDGFPARVRVEVSSDTGFEASSTEVVELDLDPVEGFAPQSVSFDKPVEGRFVRVTALQHRNTNQFQANLYVFKLAELEVLSDGRNVAAGCPASALDSHEDAKEGYGVAFLTDGRTGYDAGQSLRLRPAPLLRGEFVCAKPVRRATAHATALGNYELRVNGQPAGDDRLAPGYTQYDNRVAVRAYDITPLVRQGTNAVGAVLGDGWYRSRYRLDGYGQFKDFAQGRFGDGIPRFLAQIQVEYEDGTSEVFGTGDDWRVTLDGPLRRTSMYDGVHYDARHEVPGWDAPGFDASGWQSAVVSAPPTNPVLWPQTVHPVRVVAEYEPVSVKETGRGTWMVDFGKGIGGMCRATIDGPEGATVQLRHAMSVNPDGSLYLKSLWGADGMDTYTLKGGGPQTFEAPFTFHGFRYVEVSGIERREQLGKITALMVSDDVTPTTELSTSDERFNRLWSLIPQTYLSCLKSAMADVADRDERWGWMGDCGTIHAQALPFAFDVAAYQRKRCLDLMDDRSNDADGYFPPKSPNMEGGGNAAVWSDGALWIAWASWVNYGDRRLLREVYPDIREYVLMLRKKYEAGEEPWPFHFGDWLSSFMSVRPGATSWNDKGPAQLPKPLLQKIALLRDAHLLRRIAGVLGEADDATAMNTFSAALLRDPEIAALREAPPESGAQTAYALSLVWDASTPEEAPLLLAKLVEAVEAYGGHPSTGTLSTTTLLNALSDNGRHDLAWHLAMKPEYPSFGYIVDHGATTMWERFDTFVPGLGFNPEPMNGLNHMGFCSVADWMIGEVAGLRPDRETHGFKQMHLAPKLGGGMTSLELAHETVRGTVRLRIDTSGGGLECDVTLPTNTSATLDLPLATLDGLTESGTPAGEASGVSIVPGTTTLRLESGSYQFKREGNE
jgi:alpha-L-rhamnosidase